MDTTKSFEGYPELIQVLKRLCTDKRTGTLVITTNDKHAARFVLDEGRIIACRFSNLSGYDALPQIAQITAGKDSFGVGMFAGTQDVALPSTDEMLVRLSRQTDDATGNASASIPVLPNGAFAAIEKELAVFIGPVARMICEEYLQTAGNGAGAYGDVAAMIDAVAAEIGDPEKETDFKERARAAAEAKKDT